ncbi:uncharacterized protein [Nicotiana tomentosiformis]|uniref:uncharacterized protein n=1 Tax=Nicotiana tomentosiformis TaxID=4098 RepID=UPI00388C693B
MARKFVDKYFSAAKIVKFRRKIHNFCQTDTEIVFEAWERFKEIMRKCQHNGIELRLEQIVEIFDELSEDANQWPAKSNDRRRSVGVHQVDSNTAVQAQLEAMAKEIRKLTLAKVQSQPSLVCDFCGMGHLTHECQAIAEDEVVPGTLPADIKRNPKEIINAVSLRSGHELEDLIAKRKDEPVERQVEIMEEQKISNIQEGVVRVDEDLKKKGKIKAQKKKKNDISTNNETKESKYMPALPFPQKQRREKLDKQFERFLEVFKQVHVNIPFTEVLSQMPSYARFMKEILSKKRNVEETSIVKLTEHCIAILQNKLPQKCGDPGSFTIPYS